MVVVRQHQVVRLRLYTPSEGKIIFDGQDITKLSSKQMLPLREKIQIISQDPYSSLNPRHTIVKSLTYESP